MTSGNLYLATWLITPNVDSRALIYSPFQISQKAGLVFCCSNVTCTEEFDCLIGQLVRRRNGIKAIPATLHRTDIGLILGDFKYVDHK